MNIVYSKIGSEQPFDEISGVKAQKEIKGSSDDYCGAFSIQQFCNQGSLSCTHGDAQGWLTYLQKFHPCNFWYKDGNVQPWAYYEDYDNWQDTYGMDAVMAVYHSGHGGMDANGKFYIPMGADWGGLGCTAVSDKMKLGNEQVNYIFLSTCLSCRVLDGHNPIRTWSSANLGFRMLFGFETVSYDNCNYGKYFWEEWNKNKSFSTAWLDASWRIAHNQAPAVVACGTTPAEAQNRLFNERIFDWNHVSRNYWHWRWYYAAKEMREPNLKMPKDLVVANLKPLDINEEQVNEVIDRYGIEMKMPKKVTATQDGIFYLKEQGFKVAFGNDGSHEVQVAEPNLSNEDQIPLKKSKSIAQNAIKDYELDKDTDLTFDRIRLEYECGGTPKKIEEPYVTETTIQYKQLVDGIPVIGSGSGEVRVTVDNDGSITKIHNGTRQIENLSDKPRNTTATPDEKGPISKPKSTDMAAHEKLLTKEWKKHLTNWMSEKTPVKFIIVPDSTEIGYDIRDNEAFLIAMRSIEVDFGEGYKKLYSVKVPILE